MVRHAIIAALCLLGPRGVAHAQPGATFDHRPRGAATAVLARVNFAAAVSGPTRQLVGTSGDLGNR
jgi:hypothetical protein